MKDLKNVKFGTMLKTNDGRNAVVIAVYDNGQQIQVEHGCDYFVNFDGRADSRFWGWKDNIDLE